VFQTFENLGGSLAIEAAYLIKKVKKIISYKIIHSLMQQLFIDLTILYIE
jgi:hypothetical protein